MIPNVVRGAGFYDCLKYLFRADKKAEIVDCNLISRDVPGMAIEFERVQALNWRSTVPAWHVSLSARHDELISNELWREGTRRFIQKVGRQAGKDELPIDIEQNQYVSVRHYDKKHSHIHLLLNRVRPTGEVCYCKWDHNRAQQACREIEQELGLVIVVGKVQAIDPLSTENQATDEFEHDQLKENSDERYISATGECDRVGTATADRPAPDADATVSDAAAAVAGDRPAAASDRVRAALTQLDFNFATTARSTGRDRVEDRTVSTPSSLATAVGSDHVAARVDRRAATSDRIRAALTRLDFTPPTLVRALEGDRIGQPGDEGAPYDDGAQERNLQSNFAELARSIQDRTSDFSYGIKDCARTIDQSQRLNRLIDRMNESYFTLLAVSDADGQSQRELSDRTGSTSSAPTADVPTTTANSPSTAAAQELARVQQWSLEQQQRHFEQRWHRYNKKLQAHLTPEERDVQIAQAAISELGTKMATMVICRSPHTQTLLKTQHRSVWQAHVYRTIGAAQERSLPEEQRQQGKQAAATLQSWLKRQHTDLLEGKHYDVSLDRDLNQLTLRAKDGRGVILQQQHGHVTKFQLNRDDLDRLQALDRRMAQMDAAVQTSTSANQVNRGFGLE